MKHADSQSPDRQSPVSFVANVARLPQKGLPVLIEADAELLVAPWKRNGVKVSGRVEADITQACIVTLDPIEAHIDEAVDALFLPEQSKLGRQGFEGGGEIMLDAEGPDSPETFSGNSIDVGALAEQFFGLAIDPYPRKQGVSMEAADDAGTAESEFQQKLRSLLGKS